MLHAQTRVSEEDGPFSSLGPALSLAGRSGSRSGGEGGVLGERGGSTEKGRRESNTENEDNGKGY